MTFRYAAAVIALVACASGSAVAAPVYSTSVTVPYDPNAPSFTGSNFAAASNNSSYTVRTGRDNTYLYIDVTSTPNPNTDTSLQFSNIYLGGLNFSTALIFAVTSSLVSTTADPGTTYNLVGTGYTFAQSLNDISFALPFSFLETNPLSIIGFNNQSPGDQVRVSYSQSFGYSLVFGGNFDRINRLGAQIIPADVPEPASLALLGIGMLGLALSRRRGTPPAP